jgi:hypothetical protein
MLKANVSPALPVPELPGLDQLNPTAESDPSTTPACEMFRNYPLT